MTTQDMQDRVLAALPGGRSMFDPISLIVIGAIISTVLSHYIEAGLHKCEAKSIRKPGIIAQFQLWCAVKAACRDPKVIAKAREHGVDPATLDRRYSGDVKAALLRAAANLTDSEIHALKAL